jgi:hypothetical protein
MTYGALAVVDDTRVLGFATALDAVRSGAVPLHCPIFLDAGQLYQLGRLVHAEKLFADRPDLVDPVGQLHKERLQAMWAHLQSMAVSGETAPRAREEGSDVAGKKKEKANGGEGKTRARNADKTISVLAEKNPKREGTKAYDRFKLYKDGMTVAEFIKKGGSAADVSYDVEHKHIRLA